MNLSKILSELRKEREQIEEAVLSLESKAMSKGRRRVRGKRFLGFLKKRSDDPNEGGGAPGEGCAGVVAPILPRRPRRPPMACKLPLLE